MFLFPWHLESEVCVPGSKSLQGHADEFMSQYLEKQVGLTLHMTCDTRPWNGQLTTRQWSSICFTRNRGCLVESWKGRKKVWISKYRWRKNLAPVGMVATSWNTVIIHTMYMIYGLLWCQLLQGFCSSSTHFNAYCVFCRMFLYKISSHITMINVQFAKAFIIRQATTQFQHLSMLQVQSVSFPSLSGHHTHESEPSFKDSISCHDLIEAFGGVEAYSRTKAWSKVQRDCNSTLPIMHCVSPNCGTPTHHFLLYETMAARF